MRLNPLAAFARRHLHDYTPAAAALWLLLAAAGSAALAWAVGRLVQQPPQDTATLATGLALVAWLAWFPIEVPRTKQTVLVADVFVFVLLAHFGPAAAVLASGTEALLGALSTTKRLSSRISGPATAMAAMLVSGLAFEAIADASRRAGLHPDVTMLAALCLVGALQAVLTTAPLMWLMALKNSRRLGIGTWFDASFWYMAMVLGAAFVAGLLDMNARRTGVGVLAVVAALSLGTVALMRRALGRQEASRARQEARLAQARAQAEANQQRFTAAFTHAAVGMAIARPGGEVLQVNRAACALLGAGKAALVGRPFDSLLEPGDAELLRSRVALVSAGTQGAFSMELRCRTAAGARLWVSLHCGRYADPAGDGDGLIYQLHDITSRHVAESRLHHIAYHDGLTDLANRHCFQERLSAIIEKCRSDDGVRFAVLFLDLDRFKIVNDSLGHEAGNHLLREVGERLVASVRPTDLVARLGGDEFAVLLDTVHGADDGMALAGRVLQALSRPVPINGTEILPGASIGITLNDLGPRSASEMLRDADLAMYEAKAAGRGRIALFDQSMHARVAEKLALEADLRHAIGEGQLSVHFQPLYELQPYRLSGFEALARWTHPRRGVVSPAVFIALAEETGHIEALTDWVIDHAVAQLAQWQRQYPAAGAGGKLGMHVNISGRDLARPSLVPHVHGVLARRGLPAHQLTLEITETTLMGRLDVALAALAQLREHGVRFSIDDFGTGYSSLAYLSTLPIDSLKIDRSFVMGLNDKPGNVEIIRAVLNLGRSLGHKVIAEGIETPEQLSTLRALGVHVGQGYLLSRPLRADQVVELLALAGAGAQVAAA